MAQRTAYPPYGTRGFVQFPDRTADGRIIIAVDGEGKNLPLGDGSCANPHVAQQGWHSYTMLAASDDKGHRRSIVHDGSRREEDVSDADPELHVARNYGLPTKQCLDFLLDLNTRRNAIVCAFFFSYDVTKILADLPVKRLRDLTTAEIPEKYHERVAYVRRRFGLSETTIKRTGSNGKGLIAGESTIWQGYYIAYTPRKKFHIIDLAAGRVPDPHDPAKKRSVWAREVIVWDVFGFYQQ